MSHINHIQHSEGHGMDDWKEPTQRELIDAMNLLCEYAMHKLGDGWEIILSMTKDESYIQAIDPDGAAVDSIACDATYSCLADLCDVSRDRSDS